MIVNQADQVESSVLRSELKLRFVGNPADQCPTDGGAFSDRSRGRLYNCHLQLQGPLKFQAQMGEIPCNISMQFLKPLPFPAQKCYIDHVDQLIITDSYNTVNIYLNEPVNLKTKNDIEATLDKCLARLKWRRSDEIRKDAFTSFTLKVEQDLDKLLSFIKAEIAEADKRDDLQKVIQELFDKFRMQLCLIKRSSLVFIFEHASSDDALNMVNSKDQQQREVINILFRLLPDWVPRDSQWVVSHYTVSDEEFAPLPGAPIEISFPAPVDEVTDSGQFSSTDYTTHTDDMLYQSLVSMAVDTAMKKFERFHESNVEDIMKKCFQTVLENVKHLKDFPEKSTKEPSKTAPVEEHLKPHMQILPERFDIQNNLEKGNTPTVKLGQEKDINIKHHYPGSPSNSTYGIHEQNVSVKSALYSNQSTEGAPSFQGKQQLYDPPMSMQNEKEYRTKSNDSGYQEEFVKGNLDFNTKTSAHSETFDTGILLDVKEKGTRRDWIGEKKLEQQRDQDANQGKKQQITKKSSQRESLTQQAERLLNWVNVKSNAANSKDPEIQRMMQQVEHALAEEDEPAPKARALDTILVLDTSDSVTNTHLDQLKAVAYEFVDGIEEIVDSMNLEENLAIVQMGGRAWVRQHLTNDYSRIREVIDAMTPDSPDMKTGGRTAMFQALMVCLGAIEGRGGVVNVAGCHRVRPRIIFITDGRPTNEATEFGPDTQSNLNEVKFALVQLITEFSAKKHKTTPSPIFWVPVGPDPDIEFMKSLALLSGGKVVLPMNMKELCRYYKLQETIGCVYKMVRKQDDLSKDEQHIQSLVGALADTLDSDEKNFVIEEVRKKQKEPESDSGEPDDFDNIIEDKELVEANSILPLGTRVIRGKDWRWDNQDTDGAGTVIQHRKKKDGWLHVMWDNGTHNAYRYGDSDRYDVQKTDDHPREFNGSNIEIGVQVERGKDWHLGDEDGKGKGVVIRKRKDGKIKVRWDNGFIGKYRFGFAGKFDVKVVDISHQRTESVLSSIQEVQEEGAVGGTYSPDIDIENAVWLYKDLESSKWNKYSESDQDSLKKAYKRRKDGSCIIKREGKSYRVLFKSKQEKAMDGGFMTDVKWTSKKEYEEMRKMGEAT